MENYLVSGGGSASLESYKSTDNIVADVKAIIESAQSSAYDAINTAMIRKN